MIRKLRQMPGRQRTSPGATNAQIQLNYRARRQLSLPPLRESALSHSRGRSKSHMLCTFIFAIGLETVTSEDENPYFETWHYWKNGLQRELQWEKLRDELLDREISYKLREVQVHIERWIVEYNTFRPHSSLNYGPPEAMWKKWIVHNKIIGALPILMGQGNIPLN